MLLLLFGSLTAVMADVSAVSLKATFPGATGNIINGGGSVALDATWTGDSPPYTAKFKKGGTTIVSEPAISGTTSKVSIPASQIGDTAGTAEKLTVEIVDNGGKTGTAVADNGVIVDFIAPTLTAQITNGSVFANTQSVRIQITSNENILAPTVTSNGVAAAMEGSLTQGTSFVYNLQLTTAFTNGNYSVSISAKDLSSPAASANSGNTSVTFTVGSSATGETTITGATPASPTNSQTISLTGACPNGASTIEIKDSGTSVSTVAVTGTSWTIGVSPAEGSHSYVAISKDSNGTVVSQSSAFAMIIDRTAPAAPTADGSGLPSNTNAATVVVPVTITGIDTEVAKPVQIQTLVNGAPQGSAQAVTVSPMNITVPLNTGSNSITFRLTDAAGNVSTVSGPITIIRDNSSSSTSTIVTFDSPFTMPLPVASNYQIGAGTYKLKMVFSKDMNSTTNPMITVTSASGIKITSSAGTWVASNTYIGDFTVPANGGTSYDGAATLSISGAKDTFGNTLDAIQVPSGGGSAFFIDSTPAAATFNESTPIYISSSTPSIALSGQVSDNSSGVGYIDLIWQSTTGGAIATQSVPIMAASPSPWSYNWNASSLAAGKYNLWVVAADQAKPNANVESYTGKTPRTVIVDRDGPVVTRISLGNMGIDINAMPQPVVIASAVTRLTAVVTDTGNSGLDFDNAGFVFNLVHDSSNASIIGNKSNNGRDTIYFDFSELTLPGTYTITVTPRDVSGNTGESSTRTFNLEKDAPDAVTFSPADQRIANATHESLSINQVWAQINHSRPDYVNSTISVRYNGSVAGTQLKGASTTALIWQLHSGALAKDQSHDGRYDMSVVPKTTLGNTGPAVNGYFIYDSKPPVITGSVPMINLTSPSSKPFFGLTQSELSITVSDAPKDIITYGSKMPPDANLSNMQVPGDPNWYNSTGSGVDTTNSSFTWVMGATTSQPATVNGTKLVQTLPPQPTEATEGAIDVTFNVLLLDRANAGLVIPNRLNASYTLRYDYLTPTVSSIVKPAGGKYCKNSLPIEGLVQDNGTAADVKVSSVEWADESGAWSALSASTLPSKTASVSASISISGKADGSYSIKLRAIDLGGNISAEKTASYIVDRTPPPSPTQILPLPDGITNKRSQSFKWSASTGADQYLLQVADDSSFNNILNAQSSTSYPDLVGQVMVMTEGAFTMPKDGIYYWRVAAIETCVDGYNISAFSATRKFTVDTVKPLVVEVQPAPSSANKISTGMVTFTIRFSELVDATISPVVKITTAGGQLMNIEKTSFKEDTWIGTTVIPKNSSAIYDGTAIISIEGTTDLAGNQMAADSTNSVVINTGPSFTTKIFSNPGNEYQLMIVTKASEALQSPPSCSVSQSSARTPVVMNFLKEKFYAGSYKIDVSSPGKAYIDISGTDLYGMVGNDSFQFTVADMNASQRLNITSNSGRATLKGSEDSTYSPAIIYMLDRENLESPFVASNFRASAMPGARTANRPAELANVLALEETGPVSLKLKKCLLYTVDISKENFAVPAEKIHVYRQDKNGKWVFQGGTVKDGQISAQLTGLGRLALMADLTEPSVADLSPASMEKLETATPEIKGQLADAGSGLNKDSFKLFINEIEVPEISVDAAGNFSYKLKRPLPKGKHEIRFEVTDLAGNTLKKSFMVEAPAPFGLDEFMPYPNPATGRAMYFNYNFNQNAEVVKLKIYDTAGHRVADFDTFDFASQKSGRIRWDMRNNSGKEVANGVYFYQLEVNSGGRTLKKRGKFAVMR